MPINSAAGSISSTPWRTAFASAASDSFALISPANVDSSRLADPREKHGLKPLRQYPGGAR